MSLKKLLVGALLSGAALSGLAQGASAGQYDGITISILTRPGPVIAARLAERGKEFEAATGAKIVVNEVPFAEIFPKLQNDWTTGCRLGR
jgi:multiple sugar transport system substrate-binding protein